MTTDINNNVYKSKTKDNILELDMTNKKASQFGGLVSNHAYKFTSID